MKNQEMGLINTKRVDAETRSMKRRDDIQHVLHRRQWTEDGVELRIGQEKVKSGSGQEKRKKKEIETRQGQF